MRFMIIVKATQDSEAGVMPTDALISAMADYHQQLADAGVLLDASGLQSSADLSASLIPHGLIDEFRVCVVPTVLGGSSPLFKASPERLKLRLLEARPIETGAVILRYQPA